MSDTVPTATGTGGLVDKVGGPRNAALLAAGATVGLVALISLRKKSAPAPAPTAPAPSSGGGFDSTPYDLWNAWQQEYEGLQGEINALQTKPPVPGPTPKPKPPKPVPVPKPPVPTPAPKPVPTPRPVPAPQPTPPSDPGTQWYTAHTNDTYSGIASRYGHSWQDLWNYQLKPGIRPDDTQATLRQRGPDHALFNGSSVAIPGDWRAR